MQIQELKFNSQRRPKKRIARGGKRGSYSGRGLKGQISRAGHRTQPIIRQFLKRYPKLRGYRFKILSEKPLLIDLNLIEKKWDVSKILSPRTLVQEKIISKIGKTIPEVKILGNGELTKKIRVAGCYVSKSAKEKIEKLGGKIVEIKEFEAPKKEKKKTKTEKPAVSPTATASEKTVKPDKDKKPAKKIDQKKSKKA
ncbi:MAG TPA: uL15 family ribosomal protein [Candidatus Pacearchaeota archaeon]|nr:uL15 family ribosomal protein [Candidatus Pacearchaeota archaeon]HPM08519.1 uL15 family ribosomal protein [Candidatus Pacearchaeota archaeon]HQI74381.1 uL15 family ribosomal protein [Candidatus Pacearchaeota archaeon]